MKTSKCMSGADLGGFGGGGSGTPPPPPGCPKKIFFFVLFVKITKTGLKRRILSLDTELID